jgi:hypothetical protein
MISLNEHSVPAGFTITSGEIRFDADIGAAGSDGSNAVVDAPIASFSYVRKLSEDACLWTP